MNIGKDISGTQYDVAHVKWGDRWMMPTEEQIEELKKYTKHDEISYNGIWGVKIMSIEPGNSNWIFMPDAGFMTENGLIDGIYTFKYWTSTAWWPGTADEYAIHLYTLDRGGYEWSGERYKGFTVRPVIK